MRISGRSADTRQPPRIFGCAAVFFGYWPIFIAPRRHDRYRPDNPAPSRAVRIGVPSSQCQRGATLYRTGGRGRALVIVARIVVLGTVGPCATTEATTIFRPTIWWHATHLRLESGLGRAHPGDVGTPVAYVSWQLHRSAKRLVLERTGRRGSHHGIDMECRTCTATDGNHALRAPWLRHFRRTRGGQAFTPGRRWCSDMRTARILRRKPLTNDGGDDGYPFTRI